MNNPAHATHADTVDLVSDFSISPAPLIGLLVVIGVALIYLAYLPTEILHRFLLLGLGSLLFAWGPFVGWLGRRHRVLSNWLAVVLLVFGVDILGFSLGVANSYIVAPLIVALGIAVLGLRDGIVLPLAQSVITVLLPGAYGVDVPFSMQVVAILALWLSYLVMGAAYRPVRSVGQWVQEYYGQARTLADETQQRRGEYEQLVKELSHANQQLSRLNDIAQGLRQTAEAARTAKEQFVANVSHELRTPLNMIIGFSEMVLQSPQTYGARIPPALQADLAVIHRNAEHLTALIDDVLDLSQIEAGQMALTKEYVQFDEIIGSATQAVRPLYESRGLYLHVEVPDQLPVVFCDPTRIREVLLNLLSNAGRFTEQGGVRVQVQHDSDEVVVSVSDTGHGISSKDMGKLFQPFQQLDTSVRRVVGGTGLGLSISKRFIDLHGGTIAVQSQPGIGTTFTFHLPIIPPAPLVGDSSRWLNPDWSFLQRVDAPTMPKPDVRPRLLVLESGQVLRRLLARYLEGAEVVSVSTVEEAVDELQRTPALALLINSATIVKGMDLLKTTLSLPKGVPALVCSVPDPHDSTASMGVSDVLVKPISQDALLAALDRLGITSGTVLVVDDEPDGLQLFGRILASSQRGYRVLQARDGVEAMSILDEYHPDVILLDLVMPNMDGFQMLAMLRESPLRFDIPVIIISARDPMGQPIVSNALAVVQEGGISMRQLLSCITATTMILSVGPVAGLKPREDPIA